MSQRVNIQYSVELDKLEDTVRHLYDNSILRLKRLYENVIALNSGVDLEMIEQVHMIRTELAQIDIELGDVDRIVKGFIAFKTGQQTHEQDQQSTTEPSPQGEQVLHTPSTGD